MKRQTFSDSLRVEFTFTSVNFPNSLEELMRRSKVVFYVTPSLHTLPNWLRAKVEPFVMDLAITCLKSQGFDERRLIAEMSEDEVVVKLKWS